MMPLGTEIDLSPGDFVLDGRHSIRTNQCPPPSTKPPLHRIGILKPVAKNWFCHRWCSVWWFLMLHLLQLCPQRASGKMG